MTTQGATVADQGERIARLEGEQNFMRQQLTTTVDGLRSSIDNVQSEVRNVANKLEQLADLRHTHESNRDAITELKDTLAGVNANIERCFTEIESENSKWRADHEKDNQDTKNKLLVWHGVAITLVLVGGSVVGGFVWFLNYRFSEQSATQSQQALDIRDNRNRIEALKDKQHALELFQAQQRPQPGSTPP
jgi:hypothetical protein